MEDLDEFYTCFWIVGRFATNQSLPSMRDTRRQLIQQCNLSETTSFTSSWKQDKILFLFTNEEEKNRVLAHSPLIINRKLLVLREFDGVNLTNLNLHLSTLWVQVLGLPTSSYTIGNATTLSRTIGNKFIDCDINVSSRRFRVKVEMDLRYPLKSGFYITCRKDPKWIQFKYEGIGDFCYQCGMIDHTQEDCIKNTVFRMSTYGNTVPDYGPWLHADVRSDYHIWIYVLPNFDVKEDDESLPCKQFYVELSFYVKYSPFNNCDEYKVDLPPAFGRLEAEYKFRVPCSSLSLEEDDDNGRGRSNSSWWEIISKIIAEKFEFPPGFSVVDENNTSGISLMGSFRSIERNEKNSGRKWIPVIMQVEKEVTLPYDDYERLIMDIREEEREKKIQKTISDLIRREAESDSDLLSAIEWTVKIRHALEEIGVRGPPNLGVMARRARREATELALSMGATPKPADPMAVMELESGKVRGDELDALDPCVICTEEFMLGCVVTRMPCSHVFHKKCLDTWLMESHICPLCCFQLPVCY